MKEIVYLDDELVNSCLAQIDEGLTIRLSNSLNMTKEDGEKTATTTMKSVNAGINALYKGGVSFDKKTMDETDNKYKSDHGEVKETVLSDFSLDVLVAKLAELNLIKTDEYDDGSFVFKESSFKIFDFERLEKVSSPEYIDLFNHNKKANNEIKKQIRDYKGPNKKQITDRMKDQLKDEEGMKNFEHVHNFGKYGNAIFPNSCLFKVDNFFGVCPKENLRYNDILLSLLNESKRKVSILGIVINQRGANYIQKDENDEVIQLDSKTIASSAPTMLMDILIDSFELSGSEDYFIRPIAIYFE